MKTIIRFFLASVLMLSVAFASNAQFNTLDAGSTLSLKFNGIMPMGNFGNASQSIYPTILNFSPNGDATMGAGFGLSIDYHFSFGLSIFITADAMWNQLNKDMRIMYDGIKKSKPNYLNFPVMGGLGYKCYFGDFFGLYAEGAAGVNFLYVSPEGFTSELTEFKTGNKFAWSAGGGILLGYHLSLGVHYYSLGKQEIVPKDVTILSKTQDVRTLQFRLGVIF
ncbi:MAG: outer membrane beta-barrel protein [Bacteroidales bacterium]|nr:outer membrane beta-barrel protein [Bacteroidales bacterium]